MGRLFHDKRGMVCHEYEGHGYVTEAVKTMVSRTALQPD